MNFFNRITTILLLLLVVFSALVVLAAALELIDPARSPLGAGVGSTLEHLDGMSSIRYALTVGIASIVSLAGLYLLRLELLPAPRERLPFLVENSALGEITIERQSVCELVERTVSTLPHVRDVKARVAVGPGGLWLHCRVVAMSQAVLTELGPQIQEVVKERVEHQLGLTVDKVTTRMRFEHFREDRRALL